MMQKFDFEKYCAAKKAFNKYAMPYIIFNGTNSYLLEDAPPEAKDAYKNGLYWSQQKTEWQRITGEHFR